MKPTPSEILAGGKPFAVKLLTGLEERVTVRLLPIRLLQEYAGLIGDLAACAELFCAKPKGWADKLDHESVYAVVEEGERLNQSPFDALMNRQKERTKRLAKQAGVQLPTELAETTGEASADLSPVPAS